MTPKKWATIERLFEAASELPLTEQIQFLDREDSGDEDVRREVEKLLKANEASAGFIEASVWNDSSVLNTSARVAIESSLSHGVENTQSDIYLGRQIGAFRLVKEIGRGGMGSVYLAERSDGEFYQKAAVKMIKRGMDSDFIIRRFRHERQILASFEHPYIARLLDGGTTPEGVPFFIMEFVDGETLYRFCDARRLNVRKRLELFKQICSALEYAHQKKVIHRDIKPGNILIDKNGSPKLLDFGIAKILDPNLIHESINPTASMMRMMTPDYASPEQMYGVEVTPASDIYSLGILLYELLTGHRPYGLEGKALHEVSRVICEEVPPPPSYVIGRKTHILPSYSSEEAEFAASRGAGPAQLADDLRGELDNVIMKSIAKDPRDRYKNVAELSADISRYLDGLPVTAPDFANPQSAERTKAVAILPFRLINLGSSDDTDGSFLGLGLADALIARLSKIRRLVVRPTSSILAFGENDRFDPVEAGRTLRADYILVGTIKKANDRLRLTVQLLDVSANAAVWATSIDETIADVLTLEHSLSTRVIEVLLPQLTGGELQDFAKRGTEVPEAFEHYIRGRYHFNSFTEEGLARSFVSFHEAIAADPNYARAYAGIADYYNWLGIIGVLPPQECYQPSIGAASKAIELDPELSEGHSSLGFSLHAGNHDWARAEVHLKKALELNPNNANAYVWYSIVLYTEGRFEEGLQFADRSVEIDPLTPFNHHNIAWGLYFARRFEEAETRYRQVIKDFPSYVFGYYGLSKVHRILRQGSAAFAENRRADDLMGGSIFVQLAEAECLAVMDRTDDARKKLIDLQTIAEDRFVSPYQMALTYCYLDEPELALDHLERSLDFREAWLNWMGVEPVFDPIRDHSRFAAIQEAIGYRILFEKFAGSGFSFDVTETDENPPVHERTTLMIEDGPITHSEGARGRRTTAAYAVVVALLVVVVASVAHFVIEPYLTPSTPVASATYQSPTIMVVPFESTKTSRLSLGVGLADALTMKLGSIKSLRVISSNTARSSTTLSPAQIANEFGVTFIVRGTSRSRKNSTPTLISKKRSSIRI